MHQAPIAVFDSGVGGLSILRALRAQLPHENYHYFADSAFAPYGEKPETWLRERSLEIAQHLVREGAKALVVACNTATAAAIAPLRLAFPTLPLIGIEPAIKPAAHLSASKRIGVLATQRTLDSDKFHRAMDDLQGTGVELVLRAATGLAWAIEQGDDTQIDALIQAHVAALGPLGKGTGHIDTLVLGCTHYPFVVARIQAIVGPMVTIVDNGDAVARHTRRVLDTFQQLNPQSHAGMIRFEASAHQEQLERFAARQLGDAAVTPTGLQTL